MNNCYDNNHTKRDENFEMVKEIHLKLCHLLERDVFEYQDSLLNIKKVARSKGYPQYHPIYTQRVIQCHPRSLNNT